MRGCHAFACESMVIRIAARRVSVPAAIFSPNWCRRAPIVSRPRTCPSKPGLSSVAQSAKAGGARAVLGRGRPPSPLRLSSGLWRTSGEKIQKIFLGGGPILEAFLGGRNRISRAPEGFGGVERSIWGAKRPVFTRFWPGYGPKMGDNRPGFASQNPRFSDYVMERG